MSSYSQEKHRIAEDHHASSAILIQKIDSLTAQLTTTTAQLNTTTKDLTEKLSVKEDQLTVIGATADRLKVESERESERHRVEEEVKEKEMVEGLEQLRASVEGTLQCSTERLMSSLIYLPACVSPPI